MQRPYPNSHKPPIHKPCKYCGQEVSFNAEVGIWTNWGGDNDGLRHFDQRQGSAIASTDQKTSRILEEIASLRSELDRLRTAHHETNQIVKNIQGKITK
jgi:hypothetical protein